MTEEEQGQITPGREYGGGGGGGGCAPNWDCSEFGECSVYYNVSGEVRTRQKQDCTDLKGCYPSTIKELPCKEKIPIITERTERCGENHIMIYNNLTGKLIADIRENELEGKSGIDISLLTAEAEKQYCSYCSDKEMNFDEIYTDCGGSCPSCYLDNFREWNENKEIHLANAGESEKIYFSISNIRHEIIVNSINPEDSSVSVTINSDAINLELQPAGKEQIDINNDGIYEISIVIDRINSDRADITLRKLISEKQKISIMSIIPNLNFPYAQRIMLFIILIFLAFILSNIYYYFEIEIKQSAKRLSSGLLQKFPSLKLFIIRAGKIKESLDKEIMQLEKIDKREEKEVRELERRLQEKKKEAPLDKEIMQLEKIDIKEEHEVKMLEQRLKEKRKRKSR